MWDFSDDEWLFLWAAAVVSVVGLWRWYAPLMSRPPVGPRRAGHRLMLAIAPPAALGLIFAVLNFHADPVHVAGHFDYEILFTVGGAAFLSLAGFGLPLIGVRPGDDAIQRGNVSALLLVVGTLLGVALAYAGGNVGWGPTIWTTLVPAALAVAILFLLSALLLIAGRSADAVTIDRDPATGLRVAAFQVAAGALLGRAVAGDWEGWPGMFNDLVRLGWPVILLSGMTAGANFLANPSPDRSRPSIWRFGFVPAIVILAPAVVYIDRLGPPQVLTAAQRAAVSEVRR